MCCCWFRLKSDDHTEVVRGLSWSPLDDSLCTSGWGYQIFTQTIGSVTKSSDLHVETSKSQATSVSMDMDSVGQVQSNGDIDSPQYNGKNPEVDAESHGGSEQDARSGDSTVGDADQTNTAR